MQVGQALSTLRGEALLSTAALATMVAMDPLDLARCEAGDRRLGAAEMLAICRALGVEASDFYRWVRTDTGVGVSHIKPPPKSWRSA